MIAIIAIPIILILGILGGILYLLWKLAISIQNQMEMSGRNPVTLTDEAPPEPPPAILPMRRIGKDEVL